MKRLIRTTLFASLLVALFGLSTFTASTVYAEGGKEGRDLIEVSKYVQGEDSEWQAAHDSWDAVKIEVGNAVHWKLQVENKSELPLKLIMTDTLDGEIFDLSTHCTLPAEDTLGAADTWTCEYETPAEAGEHKNVLQVKVVDGDKPVVDKAIAVYYGVQPDPNNVIDFTVQKQVKEANGDWKDADRLWDALKVEPNTQLDWHINVINNEDSNIVISLADYFDGGVFDISAECPGPVDGLLPAVQDNSYSCEFTTTAEEGAHVNVAVVTATLGEVTETERDAAFYVAKQHDGHDDDLVEVEKKVRIPDGEWMDADRIKEALIVDESDPLEWLIYLENKSPQAVHVTLTDTFNGLPDELSNCEPVPDPFEPDAEYSCEYTTNAVAGPNVNIAVAMAETDNEQSVDRDAAVAVGIPYSVQLRDNLNISKQVKLDDGDWEDADRLYDALYAPVGATVNWKITLDNQNEVAASIVMTDRLDGELFELPNNCTTSGQIDPGASLTCDFTTQADAGTHVNVATVKAEFDGIEVGKRDAAFYTSDPVEYEGAEACGPGYWKTQILSWEPTAYAPSDEYDITFGVTSAFDAESLMEVLWQGGGHEMAFGRQAVTALLNASHPNVDYGYSDADVLAMVQDAYDNNSFESVKQTLEEMNDGYCPLGRDDLDEPGVGNPSFWRHHWRLWPLDDLFIGHKRYTKQQVLEHMNQFMGDDDDTVASSATGDVSAELYTAVAAGRLNIAAGNNGTCIEATLDAADDWLSINPVGSAASAAGTDAVEAATMLASVDAYNSGELCAPSIQSSTTTQLFLPLMHDMDN